MITIGDFDIISVQNGSIRLDGGAMFGVVPKVIWAEQEDVDDQNRILLATRTLIAVSRDRKQVILTDTGPGTKWSADEVPRFEVRCRANAVGDALQKRFGLGVRDVTEVIITHLHFDHNGGLTEWVDEPGGPTRLCFPNARHWIHREHWDYARHPTERDRASFLKRDFDLLESAAAPMFVDGDEPPTPWEGVRFLVSHGHTPGQLLPIFHDGRQELLFTGDLLPTGNHLRVPWVMAYDLEPLRTMEEKKRLLRRCREHRTWLAFPHDRRLAGARLDFANDRPFVAAALNL